MDITPLQFPSVSAAGALGSIAAPGTAERVAPPTGPDTEFGSLVLDGLDEQAIRKAMRVGIDAACRPGVRAITAGNFGGKLGPHHFHLRKIMGETT